MKIIVKPHRIIINNDKLVNEREINVSRCYFEFDEEITDDFVKEAYFTFKGNTYKQLIQNNECSFPQEVLTDKGQIEIGVVAYKIDDEMIRYNPRPAYFNTLLGSLKDDVENSEEITPTDKEQILSELANKQDTLVSGVNIKTINHETLLGEGNIRITGGGGTSDYEDLDNKPSINNVELSGNKSLTDLGIQPSGNYALESDIPTKISDLTDDSNFLESTDLKTINGNSLVGSGDITISGDSIKDELEQYIYTLDISDKLGYAIYSGSVQTITNITVPQLILNALDTYGPKKINILIHTNTDSCLMNLHSEAASAGMYVYSYRCIHLHNSNGKDINNNSTSYMECYLQIKEDMETEEWYNKCTFQYGPSNIATKKYVDDSIASAITTTLGGSY